MYPWPMRRAPTSSGAELRTLEVGSSPDVRRLSQYRQHQNRLETLRLLQVAVRIVILMH